MAFESDVIVPLYNGKGERTKYKRYRGIRKIYAGILVDKVRTDDERGSFRAERGCVDQIFTLKQIGEKSRKKKRRLYVGFIDLEKAYERVNREGLWQVLRMYDVGG